MIKKKVIKKETLKIYFLGVSLCLILISSISIGYSYILYPTLIPIYGGGETFYLDSYNNYTSQFPFFTNAKLHIIMNANDTVQIFIDNENVLNGTYYDVEIEPNSEILMLLKSYFPVTGRFTLRQETPIFMEILSISLLLTSVITIFMNLYYFGIKKKEKNQINYR
ncbi:hypothetical protein DSAG12_02598 [Promethearchaeum syntrophicum]|uniref:Uncharacterized protein n=1 Tax=Promethearchaeum syntrophicum TaxID=2594042 RepID=A0A5B9DC32_9ARCH|nr:hypothetical protein [Candidatus Prometheoarchaeum syntrophicum]